MPSMPHRPGLRGHWSASILLRCPKPCWKPNFLALHRAPTPVPTAKAKLLRALQEGEIEPLGSNRLVAFDVRIVAATSRDLPAMVREGRFREDLFYRLNVLPIRVPPLRERRSDLPAIIETVLDDIAPRAGLASADVEPAALALLQQAMCASCAMCWSRR
jgi:transcriptional regulator with AAA-type ATPase domain